MYALIVSPIPSHPQNQGNSARIAALTSAIRALGARIHFVYIALEGIDPVRYQSMRNEWDIFDVVEVSRTMTQTRADCWSLDDWYEEKLDALIDNAFEERRYAIMLVNYVWFSRAFLRASSECFKVLDTHDVFGGRQQRLLSDGVKPTWFYTTAEEESRGLDRADLIIAIQDEEAKVLASRSSKSVLVVGHLTPSEFLPPRKTGRKLRVGYIASGNPSNIYSLSEFCRILKTKPSLTSRYDFVLIGPICAATSDDVFPFVRLGYLPNVGEAYSAIDIAINPNISGSGLKIKSVEAISYGRPLVATADAMIGIATDAQEHLCRNLEEVACCLDELKSLDALAEVSRKTFLSYQKKQVDALAKMYERASVLFPRPHLSTDAST